MNNGEAMDEQEKDERTYGIINLFDGQYYKETGFFDSWIVLVNKPTDPVHVAAIESKLVIAYRQNQRTDLRKALEKALNEYGYQELKTVIFKVDYSGVNRYQQFNDDI
jgi:hypothetical protein